MNWINRTDHQTAQLIQRAVMIETHQGAVAAWAFLTRNDIPEVAIARVLAGPRRSVVLLNEAPPESARALDAATQKSLGEDQ